MKNTFKRIVSIAFAIGLILVLAACSKTIGSKQEVQVLSGFTEAQTSVPAETKPEQTTEESTTEEQTTTEALTQAPTQAVTEAPFQVPTEAVVQSPTEAPTQAPTEAPTQAPTEPPTEAPTEPPTQAPQYVVSITVDGRGFGGYGVMASCTLGFPYQPTVYEALVNCGVSIEGSPSYVSGINGLREKAHGGGSGWMFKVNGYYPPTTACCDYYLNYGDVVEWVYVESYSSAP